MTRLVKKPDRNKKLVRQMCRWYWEATSETWYPDERAMQYVLCKLDQRYQLAERQEPHDGPRQTP